MTKFYQCVVLTYSLIALAGTGQAPAGASQPPIEISQTAAETTPAETSKASAETNPSAADVSASFGANPGWGDAICPMIEAAARANGLPVAFFTRVIWRESRFRPNEVGPVTRSGQRAQGIAQFMPRTAAERGLRNPFNPVEALPKSGEFLAELRDRFGSVGLAAAAYNAGPQRVHDFVAGLRGLPIETRNYVQAITGRPVEYWANPSSGKATEGDEVRPQRSAAIEACSHLVSQLKWGPAPLFARQRDVGAQRAPHSRFAEQRQKVPSWCQHLHLPKVEICGSVHQ